MSFGFLGFLGFPDFPRCAFPFGKPLGLGLVLFAGTLVVTGCERLGKFTGEWQGEITSDPFLRRGFEADTPVRATVARVSSETLSMTVTLPGLPEALSFTPIEGAQADVLANISLEGEPLRTYIGYFGADDQATLPGTLPATAQATTPVTAPDSGQDTATPADAGVARAEMSPTPASANRASSACADRFEPLLGFVSFFAEERMDIRVMRGANDIYGVFSFNRSSTDEAD